MLRIKGIPGIVLILFSLWMVGGACTKYAKPQDLQRLEEARQSVRKAEEELNQLRRERAHLERQLSEKEGQLKEHQNQLKEIKGE
ncbi:MAG: hypothetical protein ACK4OO_01995 [bacterium]